MQGYDSSSYGDAFADVYDAWYGDISDVAATVETLALLAAEAPGLPLVELGVGTGRIAIPLAARVSPTPVIGIDSSQAMLAQLRANLESAGQPSAAFGAGPSIVLGDMIEALPDGPLGVVVVAFNTFFNLGSVERQHACFVAVAERLAPGGSFVIEAYVPEEPARTGSHVEVRSMTADRVVLSVARYDGASQQAEGQFIEITESSGIRLRPWSVRHVAPSELDAMAAAAGLALHRRWETFARDPFDDDSARQVSVYRRP